MTSLHLKRTLSLAWSVMQKKGLILILFFIAFILLTTAIPFIRVVYKSLYAYYCLLFTYSEHHSVGSFISIGSIDFHFHIYKFLISLLFTLFSAFFIKAILHYTSNNQKFNVNIPIKSVFTIFLSFIIYYGSSVIIGYLLKQVNSYWIVTFILSTFIALFYTYYIIGLVSSYSSSVAFQKSWYTIICNLPYIVLLLLIIIGIQFIGFLLFTFGLLVTTPFVYTLVVASYYELINNV